MARSSSGFMFVPLAFALLVLGAGATFAAEVEVPVAAPAAVPAPPSPAASAAESPAELPKAILETTRTTVRSTTEWLARGVDSWFGNRPFEDGGKVTDGRLEVGVFHRQDRGTDLDVRFTAHFRLPNVEHRAYLFIGRDDPRDVVRDTPDASSAQQRLLADRPTDRSFLAGLGLSLFDTVDFRVGLGARARPYAQARYDKPWTISAGQLIDFRETVFWTSDDRFGSTTALSYDLELTPTLTVRWLNAATITQESKNFEWSSILGAHQSLGRQRLLSLELVAAGNQTHGTGVGMSDLGVLVRWEQPIYKTWLFGEVVAGHFWPRPDAMSVRGRAWALGGTLKLRF